jgi:hypothetical protein
MAIYEVILGRALEKRAFRTRVLAAEILEALPRKQVQTDQHGFTG